MTIKPTQRLGLVTWISLIYAMSLASPPGEAIADTIKHKPIDPDLIRLCVNQLLYSQIFNNGDPSGARTLIDPNSAALACRGVQSRKEARDIKVCVNSLMYKTTFPDGNPSGERTIFDPRSAALACTRCQE